MLVEAMVTADIIRTHCRGHHIHIRDIQRRIDERRLPPLSYAAIFATLHPPHGHEPNQEYLEIIAEALGISTTDEL